MQIWWIYNTKVAQFIALYEGKQSKHTSGMPSAYQRQETWKLNQQSVNEIAYISTNIRSLRKECETNTLTNMHLKVQWNQIPQSFILYQSGWHLDKTRDVCKTLMPPSKQSQKWPFLANCQAMRIIFILVCIRLPSLKSMGLSVLLSCVAQEIDKPTDWQVWSNLLLRMGA